MKAILLTFLAFLHSTHAQITGFVTSEQSTCDVDCQAMVDRFRMEYSKGWSIRHPSLVKAYREAQCKVCVEIGVARGELAHALLNNVPSIVEYHAVDPFVGGYDKSDVMSAELQEVHERNSSAAWGKAVLRVERQFGDKFRLHQGFSKDMVGHFSPNSVDCIFIDGDHTFKGVQLDIQLWTPILKAGGTYFFDDLSYSFMGVIYAVDGFFDRNNMKLVQVNQHNNYMGKKPQGEIFLDYPCKCQPLPPLTRGGEDQKNENCAECAE
mmetsp:Transcript_13767/g.30370  ORF Transcript_13767/g.30370 Transcript_13767/m.30370 type:complete len:266 (+) Transcript_13767:198-995(+)|eukprot:CAMPEP_0173202712 /NCGR_PEP_ID=MMETSP1141-20130122/19122_1 /TAXON_ID=483371 /ORGANISM="non described non described, Strain CCMP2298" /LENGTH=265 /DNA_ID=CAMNT_0014128101 /DNA_START=126 /DNA_END=923 /DNA_ORIENTATION=-